LTVERSEFRQTSKKERDYRKMEERKKWQARERYIDQRKL
jgi:hypothetical protein